ncbi:ATP-dependent DNA helicase MER3 [Penicillium diatomitis]|uniref:ATP-dependent DNA helicase MER3 n=1 Tax=Penicillium diatomitis TaxID=2819901 RepID=A0A9W9X329_9EURO|nr:ATP-dependent DNA helicase MER3 [Penicillium diatomitis]KAJ5482972.1 ATP-dependent DNA helicase MER3 [Penicillium diatomitis]
MELAICRLLNSLTDERFKVVYQAPTKSLCSERFRDWSNKFARLGLKCAELTGDTDHTQLRSVQSSHIIITTPEKWDSITRKWKDHMRLMQLVKLFLIDEVHILKETRGATLEAVVSRMKNIGSNVRFVALSATVPNSEDIATWLGKDAANQHIPAHREHFGEDFRPVKLQKFVYGYHSTGNDFVLDKICGSKFVHHLREVFRGESLIVSVQTS